MAQAFVGVGGVKRNISECYVGVGGARRLVTEIYVGVGGAPRLAWSGNRYKNKLYFNTKIRNEEAGWGNIDQFYQVDKATFASVHIGNSTGDFSFIGGAVEYMTGQVGATVDSLRFVKIDAATLARVYTYNVVPDSGGREQSPQAVYGGYTWQSYSGYDRPYLSKRDTTTLVIIKKATTTPFGSLVATNSKNIYLASSMYVAGAISLAKLDDTTFTAVTMSRLWDTPTPPTWEPGKSSACDEDALFMNCFDAKNIKLLTKFDLASGAILIRKPYSDMGFTNRIQSLYTMK